MAEKQSIPISNKKKKNEILNLLKRASQKYIKLLCHHFISHSLHLLLIPFFILFSSHLTKLDVTDLLHSLSSKIHLSLPTIALLSIPLTLLTTLYFKNKKQPIYLVDASCYKPLDSHKVTREIFMRQFQSNGTFTDDSLTFQKKMLERSGIGQETYLPKSLLSRPLSPCCATAREEAETVIFGVIDDLLAKTGVRAKDIGVLVVNCSVHSPTPSFTAMIVNHYGLRGNVISYNLTGMGCSAGLISIDLAKQLLQVHPNSYALVVSTENMTLNGYFGNNRSMLLTNSLFRMGGAAILLSNCRSDRRHSKYELVHTVRTHTGANERCFSCINQEEDPEGRVGISLSKDLMGVAGETLKANITTLGPLVLPMSEQLLFLKTLILKRIFKMKIKPYIPDFKRAFEHFCIHAGGRAVLDELEKNLRLSEWHMEPSRMTLYRFGNTSSSSLWYELAYSEAKGRIRKGDRVWQIAFGSGFKCNSAVWRALRTIDCVKENPWSDEIHNFPVHVPKVVSIGL